MTKLMSDPAPANLSQPETRPTQPDPRPTRPVPTHARPGPRPDPARPAPDPARPAPDPARPVPDLSRPVPDPSKTKARTVPAQDRAGQCWDCCLLTVYLVGLCWILDVAYGCLWHIRFTWVLNENLQKPKDALQNPHSSACWRWKRKERTKRLHNEVN